jgi:hypothetical protein
VIRPFRCRLGGSRHPGTATAAGRPSPMVEAMSSYASEHPDMALAELATAGDEPLTAEDHIAIAQVHALLAVAAEMAAQRDIQQAALRSQ